MNQKHRFLVLFLAIFMIFALAACGGSDKAPEATTAPATQAPAAAEAATQPAATPVPPTPTPVPPTATPVPPTDTPMATPTPEETPSGDFAKIEDVVDSYHSEGEFFYHFESKPPMDDLADVNMTFSSDWVRTDGPAGYNSSVTISGFGAGQGNSDSQTPQSIQMIMLDDTAYVQFGDQWLNMPRDEMGEENNLSINIDDFTTGMKELERVGTEKINGIKAIHYKYRDDKAIKDVLNSILAAQLPEGQNTSDYKASDVKVSGDVWVAKKGNYPVKAEVTMEGVFKAKSADAMPQELHITGKSLIEISNINGDITIEPPADAPKPGSVEVPGFESGTFPIPDQTTVDGSMAGFTTLTSQLSVDDVTAFYDKELSKLGWTKADGPAPTWSKDGQSFTLMITPGDNNTTSIIIMPAQ